MKPATLGSQETRGLGLLVYCNKCPHHAVLPIAPLVARFGRHYPIPEVAQHCRCSACGSRDVQTRPNFPSIPGQTGH